MGSARQDVEFRSEGTTVRGHLYLPEGGPGPHPVAPAHEHRNTIASVELLLSYDVTPYPKRILLPPTFMRVAEGDDITLWDEEIRVFGQIATPEKKLFVCRDTSHMTLYSNLSRLEMLAREGRAWLVAHLIEPYA